MSTKNDCYWCEREFQLSDSGRFIKFDTHTLLFHVQCRNELQKFIDEKKNETIHRSF